MDEVEVMADVANEAKGELPLVTFALFAYNQEKYIREAIEGAFAQTYSPLEIILSDDCSTDRTFEIMQEMAARYRGGHAVIVRKSIMNVGTARHVQEVFSASSGELFVVAAGDDISTPGRVCGLVSAWNAEGRPPGVVHSGWETFQTGAGSAPTRRRPKTLASDNILEGYARSKWLPAAAPTVAYTRHVFEMFPPLSGGSIIEDAPLFFRAALIGRFIACDDALVRVRIHDANSGTGYKASAAGRWNRFLQSKVIAFRNMQADLAYWDGEIGRPLRDQVERRILAVLRSVSRLFIPQCGNVGRYEMARVFVGILISPAISPNLRVRFEYALTFVGFEFHTKAKSVLLQRVRRLRRIESMRHD